MKSASLPLTTFDITHPLPPFTPLAPDSSAHTPDTHLLHIELGTRSYPIHIGSGLLQQPRHLAWQDLPAAQQAVIVSNTTVAPLYADQLQQVLHAHYQHVHTVALPDGEQYKTWDSLNQIFDALLHARCDRKTVLYALGGGVVGDITGFAAACYMRGIPFVQVPTTLLAQVDSSVGGKTAINHPLGKNMIGAFCQPRRVICDMDTLTTLPDRELSAGLAEVIKYGPIADMAFFTWLEQHMPALRARQPQLLAAATQRSCAIKAWVVMQDEEERGLRAILNFGHTFAHAIEAGLGFGTWLHGEAVGCGMVMAAELSALLGLIDDTLVQRIRRLVQQAGLPITAPHLHPEGEGDDSAAWLAHMRLDKKAESGHIRFVVLAQPGQAALARVPDALVAEAIARCRTPHVA